MRFSHPLCGWKRSAVRKKSLVLFTSAAVDRLRLLYGANFPMSEPPMTTIRTVTHARIISFFCKSQQTKHFMIGVKLTHEH